MGISPDFLDVWTPLWRDVEPGTTFADEEVSTGLRLVLRRGYASVCAYFQVPADHPLVSLFPDYSDLPIYVHGGLTYGRLEGSVFAWGWDFQHLWDKLVFPKNVREALDMLPSSSPHLRAYLQSRPAETEWTPAMVWEDAQPAISEMVGLMRQAEAMSQMEKTMSGTPEESI